MLSSGAIATPGNPSRKRSASCAHGRLRRHNPSKPFTKPFKTNQLRRSTPSLSTLEAWNFSRKQKRSGGQAYPPARFSAPWIAASCRTSPSAPAESQSTLSAASQKPRRRENQMPDQIKQRGNIVGLAPEQVTEALESGQLAVTGTG